MVSRCGDGQIRARSIRHSRAAGISPRRGEMEEQEGVKPGALFSVVVLGRTPWSMLAWSPLKGSEPGSFISCLIGLLSPVGARGSGNLTLM